MSAPYSGRFSTYLFFSHCGFPLILVCPALLQNYCEILHLLINKTGPERRTWHNLGKNRVICHNLITDTSHPEGYSTSDRKSAILERKRRIFASLCYSKTTINSILIQMQNLKLSASIFQKSYQNVNLVPCNRLEQRAHWYLIYISP